MIVFIAGMPRSGSTFSFNIVRRLLGRRGTLHQLPVESVLDAVEQSTTSDHLIFKGHAADNVTLSLVRLGAIKAVCTVRRPEDAIASWMATFGFTLEEAIANMERWLQMYENIRSHALIVPFELIEARPAKAAILMAKHVCADYSAREAREARQIAKEFTKKRVKEFSERLTDGEENIENIGFSFYDKTSFLHRRHVSSLESVSAEERIGMDAVDAIRNRLSQYCDNEGNLI